MKLVELLAKELDVWPEDAKNITQDFDRAVSPCTKDYDLEFNGSRWCCSGGFDNVDIIAGAERSEDYRSAIVTREMWQAERDRQNGGEWKRHRGGKQPVENRVRVEYKLRCGETGQCACEDLMWDHQKDESDVMQYRVISQPQAEEVEVNVFVGKDVKIEYAYAQEGLEPEHLEWKTMGTAKIDSIFDLGSTEAKTDQIDGPIKWRDTVSELDAYIEEFTRERDALIELLASEGFALIPAVTPVMGASDVDMSDWRNWKAGDVVECVNQNGWVDIRKGSQYVLNNSDFFSFVDDVGENRSFAFCEMEEGSVGCDFKFIRRP